MTNKYETLADLEIREKFLQERINTVASESEELQNLSKQKELLIFKQDKENQAKHKLLCDKYSDEIYGLFQKYSAESKVFFDEYRREKYGNEYPSREICEKALEEAENTVTNLKIKISLRIIQALGELGMLELELCEVISQLCNLCGKIIETMGRCPSRQDIEYMLKSRHRPYFNKKSSRELFMNATWVGSSYFNVYGTAISSTPFYEGQE